MRNVFTLLVAILLSATVWTQAPQKMSYQAVVRNSSDALVTNTQVGIQVSILQGSVRGTAVYVEIQTPTTSFNGLVSIEIGTGIVMDGDFTTIDWSNGPYFIKTETDLAGGRSYTITGTNQLLSVPYALYAKTAETVTGKITESQITDLQDYATKNMNNENIKNLADPTDAQDAATKAYVDESAPATYKIGDLAHGGIVFYVEPSGTKGLVVATEDQSTAIKWRGGSTSYTTMARGDELYAGKMNTSIIISVHSAKNDIDSHAALVAANYTGGGFGDWYLPSNRELFLMRSNLHNKGWGNFSDALYWSSSEYSSIDAWAIRFNGDTPHGRTKHLTGYVRAVRAF